MQPAHSSIERRTSAGSSRRVTMSDTAKRPPGRSTRKASRSTCALSAERLMTQLEMITSTDSSGRGIASIVPLRNSTLGAPARSALRPRQLEHLVGHVQPVGLARSGPPAAPRAARRCRRRSPGRAPTSPGLQLGQRGRVAAAQRGQHRRLGQACRLVLGVQVAADQVQRLGGAAGGVGAAAGPLAGSRPGGGRGVVVADDLVQLGVVGHGGLLVMGVGSGSGGGDLGDQRLDP